MRPGGTVTVADAGQRCGSQPDAGCASFFADVCCHAGSRSASPNGKAPRPPRTTARTTAQRVARCPTGGRKMATQKLPQFVHQFYPYANYPRNLRRGIPGVQVDLFLNGSESEGFNVWIAEISSGHESMIALVDEVATMRAWLEHGS